MADIAGISDIFHKASLLSLRIRSILENPNDVQHAKLMQIFSRIAEFYKNFIDDIELEKTGRFTHDILYSEEYTEKYFSPEFLLDLEGNDLESELVFMEGISNYIKSIDTNPTSNKGAERTLRSLIAYFVYALHRAGLDQNSIINFFRAPTNDPQEIFLLLDKYRIQFNDVMSRLFNMGRFFGNDTQASQTLLDLCLGLHNKGISSNFGGVLRNLKQISLNNLLGGKYLSFEEILNLPESTLSNMARLLEVLHSNKNPENKPLPASIRKFLFYDYNDQNPEYLTNFDHNLERVEEMVERQINYQQYWVNERRDFNLGDFDNCLQMLGLTFDDAINICSNQREKFAFLIEIVKHFVTLDNQSERKDFISDYLFLFNKFIKSELDKECSFAEVINDQDIWRSRLPEFIRAPLECLIKTRSPFKGVQTLENEEIEDKNNQELSGDLLLERQTRRNKALKTSEILRSKILDELSALPSIIQYLVSNYQGFIIRESSNSLIARNIQSTCETYFPQLTEIQKQIGFEVDVLSILKELNKILKTSVGYQIKRTTFLECVVKIRASSYDLSKFMGHWRYCSLYETFQETCVPRTPTPELLGLISSKFQPLDEQQNIFRLITPNLLFSNNSITALRQLNHDIDPDIFRGRLLREFILRLEQPKVQGSAADFIRTIVINPECLDEIRDKIYESIAGKGMSRKEELTPINDGAKDLCMALGLSEKEILFTRLEGIYNRFVSPDSIQDALGGIARSEKFWTEGYGVGGKSGYSQDDIKKGAFYHSLRMWAQHMLSRAELYNPYEAKANSESNSTAYGFLFLLSQQNIMSELNDLRQLENQMPYNEFLEASVRFVKRFEPVGSKPAGEPAMFWEHQMQGLSIDAQVAKLIELGREEVIEKADTNTQVMSNELDLDRADLAGGRLSKRIKLTPTRD